MPQALLIVDHGSTREQANQMLEEVACLLRKKRADLIVHIAHMELAEPTIEQGISACVRDGATEVIIHPYMLAPGRHATQDIPNLAREAASGFPGLKVRVTGPLGLHEKIGDVVLERAGLA
ncbi:MAG: sirohydrochlorin cobaltochelatase [bacterium]|nr:sirohydrochlorin cobaltochelatase [bacterium]